ncbi:MAG: hypothetical protein RBS17_09235 [Coriobacteriia bacterium]|nr:hypothetical protein [Coriobacteriia bacterium]
MGAVFRLSAASEAGDGISGRSGWCEPILGVISEVIYAPAFVYTAFLILGIK